MADEGKSETKSEGGGWLGPFMLGVAVVLVGGFIRDELRWRRLQRRAEQAELEGED